jgi:hypothetical protein
MTTVEVSATKCYYLGYSSCKGLNRTEREGLISHESFVIVLHAVCFENNDESVV